MIMKQGFTIMEVMLTIALLGIMVSIFFPMLSFLIAKSNYLSYRSEAGLVLQEGIEVTYNTLLGNWDDDFIIYTEGNPYHPYVDLAVGKWSLSTGAETGVEGRFDRSITLSKVCRDPSSGNWSESSGGCTTPLVWDKNSKLIRTEVQWTENGVVNNQKLQLLVVKL